MLQATVERRSKSGVLTCATLRAAVQDFGVARAALSDAEFKALLGRFDRLGDGTCAACDVLAFAKRGGVGTPDEIAHDLGEASASTTDQRVVLLLVLGTVRFLEREGPSVPSEFPRFTTRLAQARTRRTQRRRARGGGRPRWPNSPACCSPSRTQAANLCPFGMLREQFEN